MPRGEIVGRFAQRWVWGGIVVVTLAALSRVTAGTDARGILKFGIGRLDLPSDVLVGLLCYFLAGLLLLSDARLAVLRGRWYNERVEIAPPVMRRWHLSGLLVLLLVAGVALLLPLGSTGWLGTALEWLIALLIRIAMGLMLLLSMLAACCSILCSWLRGNDEAQPVVPPTLPVIPTQAEATSRLPDWLGGVLLWIVIALVVGYLLSTYLRASGRLSWMDGPWLTRVRLWWRARRVRLDTALHVQVSALAARWRARRRLRCAHQDPACAPASCCRASACAISTCRPWGGLPSAAWRGRLTARPWSLPAIWRRTGRMPKRMCRR